MLFVIANDARFDDLAGCRYPVARIQLPQGAADSKHQHHKADGTENQPEDDCGDPSARTGARRALRDSFAREADFHLVLFISSTAF
jgi:hypothetical protein